MPCDVCDAEAPLQWVGPDDTHGMFLCDNCKNFTPEERFNIAFTLALEEVND